MHGSGRSQGLLIHLLAGAALGAVVVLLVWIFTGGRPFGEVVGAGDVSAPTTPAAVKAVPATAEAPTLRSAPPALKAERRGSSALRFRKPAAKRQAKKAAEPRRAAKRKPVVRVVAPPAEQPSGETRVAVVPSPAPTAAPPAPVAPPAAGGGGGAPAKPKSPGPTLWAGEG
jgi:hypothetical protein